MDEEREYVKQLRREAKAGDVNAISDLAMAYMYGRGCKQSDRWFLYWANKGVKLGDALTMQVLAHYYEMKSSDAMSSVSISRNKRELVEERVERIEDAHQKSLEYHIKTVYWAREAAKRGDIISTHNVRQFYLAGVPVKRGKRLVSEENMKEYIFWTKKLARMGELDTLTIMEHMYASAMHDLGVAYIRGDHVRKNTTRGIRWLQKAADRKSSKSVAAIMLIEFWNNEKLPHDKTFLSLLNSIIAISEGINWILYVEHSTYSIDTVYHYTDMDSIKSMLRDDKSNALRLYSPLHFNDPEEGDIFIKSGTVIDYFYEEENIEKNQPHIISSEGEDFCFHICSFSEKEDRLDLWRAYGRNGKGYSVSIKIPSSLYKSAAGHIVIGAMKPKFFTSEDEQDNRESKYIMESPPQYTHPIFPSHTGEFYQDQKKQQQKKVEKFSILKVLYGKESVDESIGFHREKNAYRSVSLGKSLYDLREKLTNLDDDMQHAVKAVKSVIQYLLGDLRYLYKNEEYKSEKECRIICVVNLSDFQKLDIDEKMNPPRLYIETLPFLFTEEGNQIIIGPNVPNKNAVEIYLNHMLARNKWKKTTTVKPSKVPYR